jgi:hypothetical protein
LSLWIGKKSIQLSICEGIGRRYFYKTMSY